MTTPKPLYIPTSSINAKDQPPSRRIFMGIVGAAGSGKTTAALTFPNPVVADFDNGLEEHKGKREIISQPFYNDEWCLAQGARKLTGDYEGIPIETVNRRDLIHKYIKKEYSKLTPEQTLIIDSWTKLQDAFDATTHCQPAYTEKGKVDGYAFWGRKLEYSTQLMNNLMALSCNVVVVFHEVRDVDSDGAVTGKIQALQQGSFRNKIPVSFNDFLRCVNVSEKKAKEIGFHDERFFFQTKQTATFDAKSRSIKHDGDYVPANYESFVKFSG